MEVAILTAYTPDMHPESRGASFPLRSVLATRTTGQVCAKWLEMLAKWTSPAVHHIYAAHPLVMELTPHRTPLAEALYTQMLNREISPILAWTSAVEGTPLASRPIAWPWQPSYLRRCLVVSAPDALEREISGTLYRRKSKWKVWSRDFWTKVWVPRACAIESAVSLTGAELNALADPSVEVAPRLDIKLDRAHFTIAG